MNNSDDQSQYRPIEDNPASSYTSTKSNPNLFVTSSQYKRFQIPPDLQICQIHQKATSFGFDSKINHEKCPCCHQNVKEELTFAQTSERNIYKINQPVGFYYTFIKMMLLALLFIIAVPGVYTLVWVTRNCQSQPDYCDYAYGLPFPKLTAYYTLLSLLLNFATLIVFYIIVIFLFYYNVLLHEKISFSNQKAADHRSFVSGFNSSLIPESDLMNILAPFGVQQIIYTYKIKDAMELLGKKNRLQAQQYKFYRDGRHEKVAEISNKIKKVDQKLIPITNLFELGHVHQTRTDKIIIKFKTKEGKAAFENEYKQNLWRIIFLTLCNKSKFVINEVNLYVQKLGDSREIMWQNLEVPSAKRYLYIFVNNVSTLIILGLSFYVVQSITFDQEEQGDTSQAIISFVFSAIILTVNQIQVGYVEFSTSLQGRHNLTGVIAVKIVKKSIASFLNVTLIPFSLLIIQSYRQSQQECVQNILTLFLVSNLATPLLGQFIQVGYFIRLYRQYKIRREGKNSLHTQIKANYLFEKNDFNLSDRYVSLITRLVNCFFYAGIFPSGALIVAHGLIITYFTSKYVLRKYSALPKISFRLGILITRIAALFPLVYSLGIVLNLYTYNQHVPDGSQYSIIMLCFSVPLSLVLIINGHSLARRFVKPADINKSRIQMINEVSFKDLNPASFFLSQEGILVGMMRCTVFREALNFWASSQFQLRNNIKQLQQEQSQIDV